MLIPIVSIIIAVFVTQLSALVMYLCMARIKYALSNNIDPIHTLAPKAITPMHIAKAKVDAATIIQKHAEDQG